MPIVVARVMIMMIMTIRMKARVTSIFSPCGG